MKKIFSRIFLAKGNTHSRGQLTASTKNEPKAPSSSCDFIGIEEAVRLLKVSRPTLRKYATQGAFKRYRFGEKRVYFRRSELEAFMEKGGDR